MPIGDGGGNHVPIYVIKSQYTANIRAIKYVILQRKASAEKLIIILYNNNS